MRESYRFGVAGPFVLALPASLSLSSRLTTRPAALQAQQNLSELLARVSDLTSQLELAEDGRAEWEAAGRAQSRSRQRSRRQQRDQSNVGRETSDRKFGQQIVNMCTV